MAIKWTEVADSDTFKNATPEVKTSIQNKYLDTYVKPTPGYKPEWEPKIRERLFGETVKPLSFEDKIHKAVKLGENVVKGVASFGLTTPQWMGALIKEQGETMEQGITPEERGLAQAIPSYGIFKTVKSIVAKTTDIDKDIASTGQLLIDANKRFIGRHKILPGQGKGEQFAFDIGSGGASVLTSIGLSYLTKNPAAIAPIFGLIQKGSVYEEARTKGKSPAEASKISTAAGIPEWALEYLGLNIFINKLRGTSVIPRILLRSGEQALQEGSQQLSEETITKLSGLRKENLQTILQKSGYAAVIGLITGAPAATMATIGENQGIIGDLRKSGLNDKEISEVMPVMERVIQKQQETAKPEIIKDLQTEAGDIDKLALPKNTEDLIRGEIEKEVKQPEAEATSPEITPLQPPEAAKVPIVGKFDDLLKVTPEAAKTPIVEPTAKGGEIQPYRVAFEIDGKVYEGKRGEIHAQLLDRLPKDIQDRYYKLLKDPDKAGFLSGFVNEEGFQTRGDIEMRTGKTPRIEEISKLSPSSGGAKGGEIFDAELNKAMKQPYEMTQEEFGNIPVIKYIRERLADKKNPLTVAERNQLAKQLVDSGIMSVDAFNSMTGQHGFGGVVGLENLTTGKPIPSKPIDLENDMGARINYIGQWQTFQVSADWFAHRHQILKALEEGKTVPKNVLAEYIEWTSGTGEENQTEWAADALRKLYPGKETENLISVGKKISQAETDLFENSHWIDGARGEVITKRGATNYKEFEETINKLSSSKDDFERSFGRQMKEFAQKYNLTMEDYYNIVVGKQKLPTEIQVLKDKVDVLEKQKAKLLSPKEGIVATPKGEGKVQSLLQEEQTRAEKLSDEAIKRAEERKDTSLELDKLSKEQSGKNFKELSSVEKRNLLGGTTHILKNITEGDALAIAKEHNPIQDLGDRKGLVNDKSGQYISDGRFLIIDKKIAENTRDSYWIKEAKKLPQLKGQNKESLTKLVKNPNSVIGVDRGQNNIATEIPNYEQVIPKLPGEMGRKELLAEFKGIMGNRDGDLHVIYQNKKGDIAGFDSGYVKMLKDYFPNSKIYITAADKGAIFVVDGEIKAVLMPIQLDEMTSNQFKQLSTLSNKIDTETAKDQTEENADNAITDFGKKIGGARKDVAEKTGPTGIKKEQPTGPAWSRNIEVMQIAGIYEGQRDVGKWKIVRLNNRDRSINNLTSKTFDTAEEARKYIPLAVVAQNHRVYGQTPNEAKNGYTSWGIFRILSNSKRPLVKGGFATQDEAMQYMATHPVEIIEHKFPFPEKPWLDRIERVGKERRGDKNVTTNMFQSTFGFRGGEFGNWNMGAEGQVALNFAYDALLDFADTLEISPQALSLNGELSIAFGARGHGGFDAARAHYELDRAVINLTKIKGAGSLAHEWLHALDTYLARIGGQIPATRSEGGTFDVKDIKSASVAYGFSYKSTVAPEIKEAFNTLMKNMTAREVEKQIAVDQAQKRADYVSKGVSETIKRIKDSFVYDHTKYSKQAKKATEKDIAKFDELTTKIVSGDYGKKIFVEGSKLNKFGGFDSYEIIREMNDLYKSIIGRSFDNANNDSYGRQLYWQIKSLEDATKRVEKAGEGATEKKIIATDYLKNAKDIDSFRSSDYWSTPNEMAARAFESYIYDKLKEQKQRSDYLVYGVENKFYAMLQQKPYPEGEERILLNESFDKLFDTIDGGILPKSATGKGGYILTDMLNPAQWDSVREFIEDDWLRVKRLIQQEGANVTETNNPYEAEIRYWGRIGARTAEADKFISDIDKDILTTAKKLNISDTRLSAEIDSFLISRHAPERNAKHGENAAGMTDQEAADIQNELMVKPYAQEINRLANKIQDLNNKTLDTLLEGEVITQELYNELRRLYKNHIPLNRVMSDEDDIVDVLTSRGFNVKGTGLKRAKGSELEVSNILTNVVANYKAALVRSEKNILDNYTLKFARENNYFDGLFEEIKAKAIGKTFDGRIILEKITDPKVLPLRMKGEQIYLKINDPQLAMALRGVNRQKIDGLMRGVKAYTRFFAGLATRYNPVFVLSNKIRDLQEVVVYLFSKKEIGLKGGLKILAGDPQSMKDVTDAIRGKDTEGARLYRQMQMDGGTTGGMGLSTREQLEINIDNIKAINRSNPRKVAQIIFNSIDNWNTIFEDSSRLSVYRQALKQGVSRNRAAVLAKEASVNFNKMGTGSPITNALYMFSNASVQGTAKMIRAMRNPKVMATVLMLLGGAVYLVAEYNDKKDKDWRKKISKWDRLNGINVVVSTDKGIQYVTIPISWGLKPIKVFFDEIENLTSGHETSISQVVGGVFTAAIESYNPAGGTDFVSTLTPSILDLPVDIARNRSWTGGRIKPDWNNSAPDSIRYFDNLREKLSGRMLIGITKDLGNNRIEISPADANYAFEQLIGGTGRFVTQTLNTIIGVAQGKVQAKEIPFVSRFYRDTPEENIRSSDKDFIEIKKIIAQQDKNRFYLGQEAELIYDGLKQIPAKIANERYEEIARTKPLLAGKIKNIIEEERLGLTYPDRMIKKLGVENGERAKYLWEKIKNVKTPKEKNDYMKEMIRKKVISEKVLNQLTILRGMSERK